MAEPSRTKGVRSKKVTERKRQPRRKPGAAQEAGTSGGMLLARTAETGRAGRAGRPSVLDRDPRLVLSLDVLMEPRQLKHPPLQWTCKSTRDLTDALEVLGHKISQRTLVGVLHRLGYDLRGKHRRQDEPGGPATHAQLCQILSSVLEFRRRRQPVVVLEVKPLQSVAAPTAEERRRADGEVARHAAATLKRWWQRLGRVAHPRARSVLVVVHYPEQAAGTAAAWKFRWAALAKSLGVELHIRHFPAATTRWSHLAVRARRVVRRGGKAALSVTVCTIAGRRRRPGVRAANGRPAPGRPGSQLLQEMSVCLPPAWNYTVAVAPE